MTPQTDPARVPTTEIRVADAQRLAISVLGAAGMPPARARPAARALVAADQSGLASHGLARLPFYIAQMRAGKVVADAAPTLHKDGAVITVDAGLGLSFAAIEQGAQAAGDVARAQGVAVVSVTRAHHFGVAGQAVEPFARAGLVALACANAPAAMAPWGGTNPLFGTNPIAFAAIDLSLSHVARGKVMLAQKTGAPIPEGWALDAGGTPTTDADAAMAGTMVPAGGAKGAALALMVELLTAGLAGANFAYQASSLFDDAGPAPNLAHFILVLDPARFAPGFADRAEAMCAAIEAQDGARLPGSRRMAARAVRADKIEIAQQLLDTLTELARG